MVTATTSLKMKESHNEETDMMKMKLSFLLRAGLLAALGLVCTGALAQLPPDFPQYTLLPNTNPAPGYLFGSLSVNNVPGYSNYFAVLDNASNPVLLNKTNSLGSLACNGLFVTKQGGKNLPTSFILKDPSFNPIYTNQAGNGFVADNHDFQVLPNGHALIEISDNTPVIDMSKLVPGGYPAALPTQFIIQEVDVDGNVIFQWRSLDHIPVTDSYQDLTAPNIGDYIHVNSLWFDETDGTIILSCRNTSEVIKISRVTGDVIWRMGGKHNQFTFTNGIPGSSDPAMFQVQHNARRLPNGNLTIFDNGYSQHSDPQYDFTRPYSRGVEYVIDEVNKTARLVWAFRHDPDIITYNGGAAERLPGGHTIITWGNDNTASPALAMTEVDAEGKLVADMALPQLGVTGSYTRVLWPLENNYVNVTLRELVNGNTYVFSSGTNVTGVTLQPTGITGESYNALTVSRQPFAPVLPRFLTKAPRVVPVRLQLSENQISDIAAQLSFDVNSFGLTDPANTTVYYRQTPGEGLFVALPTAYNWVTHQLQSEMSGFGEFIFGIPDLAEVPYPPLLIAPAQDAAVNQELPVTFFWTPKGFAAEYQLQVSTDAGFSTLLVDQAGLTETRYTLPAVAANTRYYWRVNTLNDGGLGDWSTNSFTTVPPMVQITVPNGGEAWQVGLPSIIQWKANIAEPIALDLYKGGVFVKTIATNVARIPAYTWQVDLTLTTGDDYAIKIRSTTNSALFDLSDGPFSIVASVPVAIATVPTGLSIAVDGTNYTSPANFDWVPGSQHVLEAASPQTAPDGHSRNVFTSWSQGGAQSNLLTVPLSATNYTASFTSQFLLDVTTTPPGAGTVSNYPAGPWYDAWQTVSLTAITNAGYRIYFWQGTDSSVSNTAQVTMNSYHLVQATFQPSDFPIVVVTNGGGTAPGSLIGNIAGRTGDGTKLYYVVLDNTGTNIIFSSKTNTIHRFMTPQGLDAVGATGAFNLKNETLNVVDTLSTLGYTLDTHDVKLLPNGHSFVFGTEVRTFDMSSVVSGGKTAASVTGNVIQELDANNQLVFEWHTFDHIAITNTFADMTQASFDYAHVNAMTIDPTDNNLLASLRTTSEIVKINRQTGQVMWRLGGKMNEFNFLNEHSENAPYYTVGQHDVHRLANGNLIYFDNGNISGGGITPNDRTYSRVVEYALDETNRTATLVWEFRHTPDISATCTGSLKRFPNGNTLIDWGCAVPTSGYIVTEVDRAGQVVFEMKHRQTGGIGSVLLGGGLTKQVWNSPDLIRSATYQGIQSGQTYTAATPGVSVTVNSLSAAAENTLVVDRHLDAVRFPQFPGKAPQVVMEHIVLSGSNISSLEAQLDLSLPDTSYVFDTPLIHDPSQVVVYQRATPGQGQFSTLPTVYDAGTQKLRITTTQLGEFVFGYPDVSETPYVPTILSPADQSQVNQAQPIALAWTPQGLVGSFDLQLATDAAFANLVIDTNGLVSSSYTLQNPLPNTQYFWRVRVVNQGGASDWASASFTTVPPVLKLTYPAGGEVWQRFQVVTISWIDNLSENLALDLYLDGVSNRTFVASTANSGSYTWTVGQFSALPQSTNYTIKIRSTTNPTLFDFSQPFSIISNLTLVTITTVPTNLAVAVDGTNYTAPAVFNWLPTSTHIIDAASPQVAADGHSRSVFVAWSDGGAQAHSITVPFSNATNTASFTTNYLLDISTAPADAGSVTATPTGPWYDAGQLVSLTANPNTGYLFYAWDGVASQSNNAAQLTMNGYGAVQAKFIPVSGVPIINTASFVLLPDGRVQFSLTGGAGVATQATVWATAALASPDWQVVGTVPLTGGTATFIEDTAPTTPTRFYRVTLP